MVFLQVYEEYLLILSLYRPIAAFTSPRTKAASLKAFFASSEKRL
jgi:hypothetical protein